MLQRWPPLKSCRGLKRPSYRGSTKLPPAPPMAPLAFELLAFDDDELLLLAFDELELAFVESGTIDEWALEELANENPGGRVGFGIFGGCGGFLRGVRGLSPAAFGLSAAPGVGTVGRLSLSFGGMTGVGKPMLSGLSEDEESVKVTSDCECGW